MNDERERESVQRSCVVRSLRETGRYYIEEIRKQRHERTNRLITRSLCWIPSIAGTYRSEVNEERDQEVLRLTMHAEALSHRNWSSGKGEQRERVGKKEENSQTAKIDFLIELACDWHDWRLSSRWRFSLSWTLGKTQDRILINQVSWMVQFQSFMLLRCYWKDERWKKTDHDIQYMYRNFISLSCCSVDCYLTHWGDNARIITGASSPLPDASGWGIMKIKGVELYPRF